MSDFSEINPCAFPINRKIMRTLGRRLRQLHEAKASSVRREASGATPPYARRENGRIVPIRRFSHGEEDLHGWLSVCGDDASCERIGWLRTSAPTYGVAILAPQARRMYPGSPQKIAPTNGGCLAR